MINQAQLVVGVNGEKHIFIVHGNSCIYCRRVFSVGGEAFICEADKRVFCVGCKREVCVLSHVKGEHIDYLGVIKEMKE